MSAAQWWITFAALLCGIVLGYVVGRRVERRSAAAKAREHEQMMDRLS